MITLFFCLCAVIIVVVVFMHFFSLHTNFPHNSNTLYIRRTQIYAMREKKTIYISVRKPREWDRMSRTEPEREKSARTTKENIPLVDSLWRDLFCSFHQIPQRSFRIRSLCVCGWDAKLIERIERGKILKRINIAIMRNCFGIYVRSFFFPFIYKIYICILCPESGANSFSLAFPFTFFGRWVYQMIVHVNGNLTKS